MTLAIRDIGNNSKTSKILISLVQSRQRSNMIPASLSSPNSLNYVPIMAVDLSSLTVVTRISWQQVKLIAQNPEHGTQFGPPIWWEFANQLIVRSAQLSNGSSAQAKSAGSGPNAPIERAQWFCWWGYKF